jgi:hypothetical protein
MHKTTRGLTVVRIAINNTTFNELERYAEEYDITYNKAIKELLHSWAQERIVQRKRDEEDDAFMANVSCSPPTT